MKLVALLGLAYSQPWLGLESEQRQRSGQRQRGEEHRQWPRHMHATSCYGVAVNHQQIWIDLPCLFSSTIPNTSQLGC
jgi:hypothetical protein